MNPTTPNSPDVERVVSERIDALTAALRDTELDPIARAAAAEPLVQDISRAWAESGIVQPSGSLLARAQALKVELSQVKFKIDLRGQALARVRRVIREQRGGTYSRTAERVPF